MMSFVFGFLTALTMIAVIFCIFRYRTYSVGKPKIKGYLDLIPDLTEDQREKVAEIRRTFLPRVARIRRSLCQKRSELAELLFAEPADPDAIHAVAREILLFQSEMESEVIDHILEEKELLTAPQKRRFYEIIVEQFSTGGLGVHDVKGKPPGC